MRMNSTCVNKERTKMADENEVYNPNAFIEKLKSKINSKFPHCPYCGCNIYTTPQELVTLPVGKQFRGMSLGQTAPCAMVVCTTCGHVDLFALGTLGLMPHEEKAEDKK